MRDPKDAAEWQKAANVAAFWLVLDRKMRDPKSAAEWQEAADTAAFLVLLESNRAYGLVTGGPEVDVRRCEAILAQAKERGFEPHDPAK